MSRPPASATVLAFFLSAAILLLLVPVAQADHAYSHRYIVYGRVVDANGDPVPGVTIDLGYEKPFAPEGPCNNQPGTETQAFGPTRNQPVTNQQGEFIFCFHTHGLSRSTPGVGILRIDAYNVNERVPFDGFMRYSFVPVKLAAPIASANKTAASQEHTVLGRVWEASSGEIKVEGVGVYGDTIKDTDYTVTVTVPGAAPQIASGKTNGYGDFSIRVPLSPRPSEGNVKLEIAGRTFEEPLDATMGATHIRGQIGDLKTSNLPNAPFYATIGLLLVAAVLADRRR